MDRLSELNPEEIDILTLECEQEIKDALSRLALLVIERDTLRRKIRLWREEMDVLELLKSGVDFNASLIDINPSTFRTLQKRYNQVADKYNNLFAGANKLKITEEKNGLNELLNVDVSRKSISEHPELSIRVLTYSKLNVLRGILSYIFEKHSSGVSLNRLSIELNISELQLSLFVDTPGVIRDYFKASERWINDLNLESHREDFLIHLYTDVASNLDVESASKNYGLKTTDIIELCNAMYNLVK